MPRKLDPTYGTIYRIAYPLMLSNLAATAVGVVDTAFMGDLPNSNVVQGAVGYVGLLYFFLFTIGFGFSKGLQVLLARQLGANELNKIGPTFLTGIALVTSLGCLFTVLYLVFGDVLMQFLIADAAVLKASLTYLNIRILGLAVSFLIVCYSAFYTAFSNTKIITAVSFFIAGINILLDWLLVFGKLGFPALGIEGAAYASVIAEVSGLLIFMIFHYFGNDTKQLLIFKLSNLNWISARKVMVISGPLMMQFVIGLGAWLTFFTYVEKMGQVELTISSIIKQVYAMVGIPAFALAGSVNTLISNLDGQGRVNEIYTALKRTIIMSLGFAVVLAFIMLIAPKFWIGLFNDDVQIINATIQPFYVIAVSLMIFSVSTIVFNGIVSLGNTIASMLTEWATIAVYASFVSYLFYVVKANITVMWFGEWVYWLTLLALSIFIFRNQLRQRMQIANQ